MLPVSVRSLVDVFFLSGAIVRELFTPRGTSKDETVYDFFSRRMNNEVTLCNLLTVQ